jgi:hypothetical protein
MRAIPVAVSDVPHIWPLVEGWFAAASRKGDGWWTMQEAYRRASLGQMALWIAAEGKDPRGAALCEIEEWPDRRVCHIALFGGRGLKSIAPLVEHIESWAKSVGASEVQIRGRRGMQVAMRSHGYKPRLVTLRKDL